ncbi:MAG: L-threonylcarbamoyladenylate synthase [Lachnospiraceae bacterium]
METKIVKISEAESEGESLREAADILKRGGLVAFPTETVYGLGGDALRSDAAHRIYEAKGRPSDNPLIVHIADMVSVSSLAKEIPEQARMAMEAFWPGPLTVILNKTEEVPRETTGGLDTVAIRMPDNPVTLSLIRQSGIFLAGPSANTSGRPSPTTAEHVKQDLNGKVDMILDHGAAGIGIESTIVDFTGEMPMILRPGYITKTMLEQVIGPVCMDAALDSRKITKEPPKAPGMKYKHYAPKADLTIVEGTDEDAVFETIHALTLEQQENGRKVGVIATTESVNRYSQGIVKVIGTREKDTTIAAGLYQVLREFDEIDVDVIYSEAFTDGALGQAIMNRLLKAAGYRVIRV